MLLYPKISVQKVENAGNITLYALKSKISVEYYKNRNLKTCVKNPHE